MGLIWILILTYIIQGIEATMATMSLIWILILTNIILNITIFFVLYYFKRPLFILDQISAKINTMLRPNKPDQRDSGDELKPEMKKAMDNVFNINRKGR